MWASARWLLFNRSRRAYARLRSHPAQLQLPFEEVRIALEAGESVKLSGFGNFQLREKPQRPGRNPKTGEEIPITARRVVTFHASQKLKAMVEAANHAGSQPS